MRDKRKDYNDDLHPAASFLVDPQAGPRISNWPRYDPKNASTIAILGTSESAAVPGDAFSIDEPCEYWNTILPIYPQVCGAKILFLYVCRALGLMDKFVDIPCLRKLDVLISNRVLLDILGF